MPPLRMSFDRMVRCHARPLDIRILGGVRVQELIPSGLPENAAGAASLLVE